MNPEFREVIGHPGYLVSDHGEVVSFRSGRFKALSQGNVKGYRTVNLGMEKNRFKMRLVHHLVLEAFVGARPIGMETRHLNGKPADNTLDNLAWGTPLENGRDRVRHGTVIQFRYPGRENPKVKLTEEQVLRIRDMKGNGNIIGKEFGVSRQSINNIRSGRTWSHLKSACGS